MTMIVIGLVSIVCIICTTIIICTHINKHKMQVITCDSKHCKNFNPVPTATYEHCDLAP